MGQPKLSRKRLSYQANVHEALNFLRTVTRRVRLPDGTEINASERQLLSENRLRFCSVRFLGQFFTTNKKELGRVLDTSDHRLLYVFLEQCSMRGGKLPKLPNNHSNGDRRNFENLWRWFFRRYATLVTVEDVPSL